MSEENKGTQIQKSKKYMLQFPTGTSTKSQTEYLDKVTKGFEKGNIVTIDSSIKVHYVPVEEEKEEEKPTTVEIGKTKEVEADDETKAAIKAAEEAAKATETPKKNEEKKSEQVETNSKKTETETPTKQKGETDDSTNTEGNTTVEKVVVTNTPSENPDDNVVIPATSESSDD